MDELARRVAELERQQEGVVPPPPTAGPFTVVAHSDPAMIAALHAMAKAQTDQVTLAIEQRAAEMLHKAAVIDDSQQLLFKTLKGASANTSAVEAVQMLISLQNTLVAVNPAARRVKLVALLGGRSQQVLDVVGAWEDAKLNDAALRDRGAPWRGELLTLLQIDRPSLAWLCRPQEGETVAAFLQRSQIDWVLPLVKAGLSAPPLVAAPSVAVIVDQIVADQLKAAIRPEAVVAPLLAALSGSKPLDALGETVWAQVKFGRTRGWDTKDIKGKGSHTGSSYALMVHDGKLPHMPHELARRVLHVGNVGASLRIVDAHLDTCGTHVLVTRALMESFDGRPCRVPLSIARPLTSLVLADASVAWLDEPLQPVLLDVACAAFGPAKRKVTAYVVDDAPFPLIIGVSGMRELGGVWIGVGDLRSSSPPVVTLGDEVKALQSAACEAGSAKEAPVPQPAAAPELPTLQGKPMQCVMLMFDDMAVDLYGPDIADGHDTYLSNAQIAAARRLATMAGVGELDNDSEAATMCLFRPDLSKPGFDSALDRVPPPPSDAPREYRFASGTGKFMSLIDQVDDMPTAEKADLKRRVAAIPELTMLSEEAPPRSFGPVRGPGSVYVMRIRHDADWSNMFDGWRPMSPPKMKVLKEVKEMWLRWGIIEPVQPGESRIVSQPVVVPKRNVDGMVVGHRVAVDLRKVNRNVVPDRYSPMPMSEMLRWAADGAWRLTVMDMKALFNQFSIHESQRYLTTVMLGPGEYYRFVGAPFGLTTILAWTQRFMDQTFQAEFVRTFIDDSAIKHGAKGDWRAASDQIVWFLERAASVNMAINVDKVQLMAARPHLLGHDVDCNRGEFRPRLSKLDTLANWTKMTTNKAVDSFLAHGAAWASYVPGWNLVAPRISSMVVRGRPLQWTADGEKAFGEAKAMLRDAVPKMVAAEGQIYLFTDGQRAGLGWAVAQEDRKGQLRLIDAGGRRTESFERRLNVVELEFLAGREAMLNASHLLLGHAQPPIWRTDSKALIAIREQRTLPRSDAVRRWVLEMQYGDWAVMKCEHVEGSANPVDAIGRQWDDGGGRQLPMPLLRKSLGVPAVVATGVGSTTAPNADGETQTRTPELRSPVEEDTEPASSPSAEEKAEDDRVLEEPEPAQAASDDGNDVRDEPEPSTQQIEAVIASLANDPETAQALHDQQTAWGLESVRDTSSEGFQLRNAAQGKWVHKKKIREMKPTRDAWGRLFVTVNGAKLLYVPPAIVEQVVWAVHSSAGNGGAHRRSASVMAVIRKRFYIPQLEKRVGEVLARCAVCQQTGARTPDGVLGTDNRVLRRFGAVHIDVVKFDGEQPYALTMIDRVSGAFEYVPMAARTADLVADAYRNGWLLRYGAPDVLVADNAQEIVGVEITAMCDDTGTKLDPVPPRTPQANGLVERLNRTFKTAVRALTPLGGDWRAAAPQARWSIMCAVSSTRGFSPYQLVHGEAPVLAVDQQQRLATGNIPPAAVVASGEAKEARWRFANASQAVNADVAKANATRAASHAGAAKRELAKAGGKPMQLAVGDVVLLENNAKTLGSKFDNMLRRTGPYSVVRVDERRKRVKLVRWDNRAPYRGSVSWHRVTKAVGWAAKPVTETEANARAKGERRNAAQSEVGTTPIRMVTDYGVVVDVVNDTSGVLLLMEEELEGVKHLKQISGSLVPYPIVREAFRAKRLVTAPRAVKRAVEAAKSKK